jgi:hypothetical protein
MGYAILDPKIETELFNLSLAIAAGPDKSSAGKSPAHLLYTMSNPVDRPELPNVLLVGDSISEGYTLAVRRELEGRADVFRVPVNCSHSGAGVVNIRSWLGNREWHVIHFNFGIWDVHYLNKGRFVDIHQPDGYEGRGYQRRYSTPEYVENLKAIIAAMKQTGATLIWASTTPFVSYGEQTKTLIRKNNAAAATLMRQEGVYVNDLYALALPNLAAWQLADGCHFSETGYRQLGLQVAELIEKALHKPRRRSLKMKADGG